MTDLKHIPLHIKTTFARIFESILKDFPTIIRYQGRFEVLRYLPESFAALRPTVDIMFKATYNVQDLIFIVYCRTDDTIERKQTELFIRRYLEIIELYINMPFTSIPLHLPVSENTGMKGLAEKIVASRLRTGV